MTTDGASPDITWRQNECDSGVSPGADNDSRRPIWLAKT